MKILVITNEIGILHFTLILTKYKNVQNRNTHLSDKVKMGKPIKSVTSEVACYLLSHDRPVRYFVKSFLVIGDEKCLCSVRALSQKRESH